MLALCHLLPSLVQEAHADGDGLPNHHILSARVQYHLHRCHRAQRGWRVFPRATSVRHEQGAIVDGHVVATHHGGRRQVGSDWHRQDGACAQRHVHRRQHYVRRAVGHIRVVDIHHHDRRKHRIERRVHVNAHALEHRRVRREGAAIHNRRTHPSQTRRVEIHPEQGGEGGRRLQREVSELHDPAHRLGAQLATKRNVPRRGRYSDHAGLHEVAILIQHAKSRLWRQGQIHLSRGGRLDQLQTIGSRCQRHIDGRQIHLEGCGGCVEAHDVVTAHLGELQVRKRGHPHGHRPRQRAVQHCSRWPIHQEGPDHGGVVVREHDAIGVNQRHRR
mmetsp:Transcript_3041/g.9363  ORF Transcript_3041/g.9363 Transcript_3041/m.9363 type:complete len:331 (-) Transcript_3041:4132-5124(-)